MPISPKAFLEAAAAAIPKLTPEDRSDVIERCITLIDHRLQDKTAIKDAVESGKGFVVMFLPFLLQVEEELTLRARYLDAGWSGVFFFTDKGRNNEQRMYLYFDEKKAREGEILTVAKDAVVEMLQRPELYSDQRVRNICVTISRTMEDTDWVRKHQQTAAVGTYWSHHVPFPISKLDEEEIRNRFMMTGWGDVQFLHGSGAMYVFDGVVQTNHSTTIKLYTDQQVPPSREEFTITLKSSN
jgi:hypothetical protein